MSTYTLTVFLFLALIFIGRFLQEKAMKKLDQEKKAKLITLFSKDRLIQFGIVIASLGLFYGLSNIKCIPSNLLFIGFVLIMIFVQLLFSVFSVQKLKKNNYPDDFVKSFVGVSILRFISVVGIIILVTTL